MKHLFEEVADRQLAVMNETQKRLEEAEKTSTEFQNVKVEISAVYAGLPKRKMSPEDFASALDLLRKRKLESVTVKQIAEETMGSFDKNTSASIRHRINNVRDRLFQIADQQGIAMSSGLRRALEASGNLPVKPSEKPCDREKLIATLRQQAVDAITKTFQKRGFKNMPDDINAVMGRLENWQPDRMQHVNDIKHAAWQFAVHYIRDRERRDRGDQRRTAKTEKQREKEKSLEDARAEMSEIMHSVSADKGIKEARKDGIFMLFQAVFERKSDEEMLAARGQMGLKAIDRNAMDKRKERARKWLINVRGVSPNLQSHLLRFVKNREKYGEQDEQDVG